MADIAQGELDNVVNGIVVGDISVSAQQISAGNFAIVVEDFFTLLDWLDGLHDQCFLFLVETRLANMLTKHHRRSQGEITTYVVAISVSVEEIRKWDHSLRKLLFLIVGHVTFVTRVALILIIFSLFNVESIGHDQ